MSYTRSFCEGIVKAKQKKWISGNVVELGRNNFHTKVVEKYVKAQDPSFLVCRSAQELWLGCGASSYVVITDDKLPDFQYDVVINQTPLEEMMDTCEALRRSHALLKVGGFMFTNLPIGISVGMHSFTLNFWQTFAEQNNYEIRYCQVSDENANFPKLIPMGTKFSYTSLRDVLYKYRETWTLRMTLVLQKKTDNPLVFDTK